jgi:1,4-dihydroxy-2-naphthoate octaprenyltransferase
MLAFGGMLAEGFLLGFAFLTVSKSISNSTSGKVKDYLRISTVGVITLFVSFFANPSAGSYVPFGVLSASFFVFGTYLFFAGIYSSAISIASDIRIRETIRTSLLDKSELLDNIGLADINRELERDTKHLVKKHEENHRNETGIESATSDVDMKNYLDEVIAELRRVNKSKFSNDD